MRNVAKNTIAIAFLIIHCALLFTVLGCTNRGNSSDDSFTIDPQYLGASISINEGAWPVEGYSRAVSGNSDSSFDYPTGWNVNSSELAIGQEAPRAEGGIDIYIFISDHDVQDYFEQRYPGSTRTELDMPGYDKLELESISGVPVENQSHYRLTESGEFRAILTASDPRTKIEVICILKSNSNVDACLAVLNRVFESMQLDFDAMLEKLGL